VEASPKNGVMERPPRELLTQVCREIEQIVRCDRISLALPSDDGERFVVMDLRPENGGWSTWEVPREKSCAGEVLKRRHAELCPRLGDRFRYPEEEVLYKQGMRGAAFLPLLAGGEPMGVLILGSRQARPLEAKGIRLLERASGLLAAAVEASRHEAAAGGGTAIGQRATSLQRAYHQLTAFSRIAGRILHEDDLNAVCTLFLDGIREHTGYPRAVLTLIDAQGMDFQWFFTGLSDDDIDYFHAHRMSPAQRREAFQERHRVGNSFCLPASAGLGYGGLRPPAGGGGEGAVQDLLFIPLYGAGAELVGTLMLQGATAPEAPTAESLSALELFANQVANAIEKKRLDQVVKSAQARLRTAQEQLMQAEKMTAIGQLISGVTHELNNPLAGIMGFAQLILGSETNPKARKNLERIYNEAVRCQKIVQNLLTFSRRHKPEKSYQSLNLVIDSVLELRAYQLQVDNVEVVRRYDPGLPRTMLDFHQMQQVVLNIVNNAHQAMMEQVNRPRRLTVATEHADGLLRARFTDSGPGIPRDRLDRIFEPFFTTKKAGRGTGLGLSVSRSIVKEHQGTVSAESLLGEGTTLVVELPIVDEPKSAEAAEPVGRAKTPSPPVTPLRLLVVDDEQILVELLTEFLRIVGHSVDQAYNGRQALELGKTRDYDVILSDLKMPGLDGQGFYEQLCKVKPAMAQRFIFSTGDLANPKVQTFFQTTGCLYLSKPFKLEAVLTVLGQLLRRLRAA
jgi:signal transduction histidine kinase/CheY-like chemotaxis protein